MPSFLLRLAEVEENMKNLKAGGHGPESPQIRALELKRSRIAASAKDHPKISRMTLAALEEELAGLRPWIKMNIKDSPLCEQTRELMCRRNLALKDAIALRQRQSVELEQSEAA